jgi:hypothetical protein
MERENHEVMFSDVGEVSVGGCDTGASPGATNGISYHFWELLCWARSQTAQPLFLPEFFIHHLKHENWDTLLNTNFMITMCIVF